MTADVKLATAAVFAAGLVAAVLGAFLVGSAPRAAVRLRPTLEREQEHGRALERPRREPVALGAVARSAAPSPAIGDIQRDLRGVVAALRQSVVSIEANAGPAPVGAGLRLLTPFRTQGASVGSGVLIDAAGHLLTVRQVVGDAEAVQVTLSHDPRGPLLARRLADDPSTGLVLLLLPPGVRVPFASLGDSSRVRTGDLVFAVGSPFGFDETVTQGIVSSSRRQVLLEGLGATELIQSDAAVNRGNCGGPLANIRGEVIGVNLAIYSTDSTFSGIGFAIPSNAARDFVERTLGVW